MGVFTSVFCTFDS